MESRWGWTWGVKRGGGGGYGDAREREKYIILKINKINEKQG